MLAVAWPPARRRGSAPRPPARGGRGDRHETDLVPLAVAIAIFLVIRPAAPQKDDGGVPRVSPRDVSLLPRRRGDQCHVLRIAIHVRLRSLEQLFSAAHIGPNAALYGRRLWRRRRRHVARAGCPFVVARRDLAVLLLFWSAIVTASYLPYRVFHDWWALRFLLPMLPLVTLGAVATGCRGGPVRPAYGARRDHCCDAARRPRRDPSGARTRGL